MFRGGKIEDSVGKQTMYYVIRGCTFTDASLYTVYLHHTHIIHITHLNIYYIQMCVCMANLEEAYPVVIKQPLACDGYKGKVFWGTFCESPLS